MFFKSVILSVSLTPALLLADWPQLGGPNRDNVATDAKLAQQWPADGPAVLWSTKVGEGYGGAAISDGEVFILDRVANQKDVLRCIDLQSGKELWTYSYDVAGSTGYNGSRAVPSVTAKHVFTSGPFGQLTCVDRKTHAKLWQTNILAPGAKLPPFGLAQCPLLYQDLVIIANYGGPSGLTAYDQATGKIVWTAKAVPGTAYSSPTLLTIADRPMVLQTTPAGVWAVDPKDGKPLWSFAGYKCNTPIPFAIKAGENRLFVTGGYDAGSVMIQIKEEAGRFSASELWRLAKGSQIHEPIFLDGRIYLNGNTNSTKDNFICVNAHDGKILWQAPQPALDRACILYADGRFFMIDTGGNLHMARAGDSSLELSGSTKQLGTKEIWAPIAYSDGVMVVRDKAVMKALAVGAK